MSRRLQAFDGAMMAIYLRAKSEAGYNATNPLGMPQSNGGLVTAKQLINPLRPSDGYTHLHECGRPDLTVETMVVENPRCHTLFTPDELAKAKRRLRDFGYAEVSSRRESK